MLFIVTLPSQYATEYSTTVEFSRCSESHLLRHKVQNHYLKKYFTVNPIFTMVSM